ncbi:MAG: EF-hand domain-containing protein [Candidatus Xenobiia bacterium LiM19]
MVNAVNGKSGFSAGQMAQQIFQGIDTGGKGYIDKSQLEEDLKKHGITDQTKINEIYKTMDADSDGKITESEFTSGMKSMKPPKPSEEMKSMLSELSGSVSASDLKALFDQLTGASGRKSTESEFTAGMEKMKPPGGAPPAGGPPPPGGPPPSGSTDEEDDETTSEIDLTQLTTNQQETLKSLLEMMQEAYASNSSSSSVLKGMFFDTAR